MPARLIDDDVFFPGLVGFSVDRFLEGSTKWKPRYAKIVFRSKVYTPYLDVWRLKMQMLYVPSRGTRQYAKGSPLSMLVVARQKCHEVTVINSVKV